MYFPKSKIQSNLYSNGEFLLKSSKATYYGSYFSVSGNRFFTGKEPNDGKNLELIKSPSNEVESLPSTEILDLRYANLENSIYTTLTNSQLNTKYPIPFTPQPTQGDYQTGEITRLFAKKANENVYYEVADNSISQNPIYFSFNLQWIISGEESYVKTTNQKMVELYMRQLPIPAFNQFLKNDYLKFWKPS